MSAQLDAVRESADLRRDVEHDFRAALRAAREAGHTYAEIGRAAGLTLQGVRYLLLREESKP